MNYDKSRFDKFIRCDKERITPKIFFRILALIERERVQLQNKKEGTDDESGKINH